MVVISSWRLVCWVWFGCVRSSRRLGKIFVYYVPLRVGFVSLKELDFIDTFLFLPCVHFSLQHPFRTRNALLPKSVLPLLHTLPCLFLFVSCWVYVSNYYDIEDWHHIHIITSCPYHLSLPINRYQIQICLSRIYNLILVSYYTLLLESLWITCVACGCDYTTKSSGENNWSTNRERKKMELQQQCRWNVNNGTLYLSPSTVPPTQPPSTTWKSTAFCGKCCIQLTTINPVVGIHSITTIIGRTGS